MQGENDFNAVEEFRGDDFFTRALNAGTVPSCSTPRQRMDTHVPSWFELTVSSSWPCCRPNTQAAPYVDFGALPCGYMAVDWGMFVMNNLGTQKEAVGRTYQGVGGYTPSTCTACPRRSPSTRAAPIRRPMRVSRLVPVSIS